MTGGSRGTIWMISTPVIVTLISQFLEKEYERRREKQ